MRQDDIEMVYKERAEFYKELLNVISFLTDQLYYQPDQKSRMKIETHISNLMHIQELLRMIFTPEVTSTQIMVALSALRSAAPLMLDDEKHDVVTEVLRLCADKETQEKLKGVKDGYLPNAENVADNIKQLRQKLGITQTELAKRLGLKSSSTVVMWESGERNPPSKALPHIAETLQCTIQQLFEERGERE